MQKDIVQHKGAFLGGTAGRCAIRLPALPGPQGDGAKAALLKDWRERLGPKNRFIRKHWLRKLSGKAREDVERALSSATISNFIVLQ